MWAKVEFQRKGAQDGNPLTADNSVAPAPRRLPPTLCPPGTNLTVEERQGLHGLEREPGHGEQEGAEHRVVLHQQVVDRLLLQGQLHDGHRALHSEPRVLRVQNWGLHFVPAHIGLQGGTEEEAEATGRALLLPPPNPDIKILPGTHAGRS